MRTGPRRAFAAAAAALWLSASPAQAQGDADMEKARELFQQGLKDMLEGRFESGCPTLQQSFELSKLAGAQFTLAECHAKWGNMATALKHYRGYLVSYSQFAADKRRKETERQKIASDQVAALSSSAPKLIIKLPDGAGDDITVTRDGEPVPRLEFGVSVPVDPGEHVVEATGPGGVTFREVAKLAPTETKQVAVRFQAVAPKPAPDAGGDGSTLRTAGFVVGGVGAAGVLLGIGTGVGAIVSKGGIDDNCIDLRCNQEGLDAADTTQLLGNVSTAGLIVGGAALTAGVVMIVVAPSDDPEAAAWSSYVKPTAGGAVAGWSARF